MKKRCLALALVFVLCLSLAASALAAEAPATIFDDVPAGAYYVRPVRWATGNSITSGTGARQFSPDDPCTRGQIITFLYRAAHQPEVTGGVQVSDAKQGDFFYNAVLWAKEQGMFEGDVFRPYDPCTRLMAVEFLWKRIGAPAVEDESGFTDVRSDAVDWAVHMGVTTGTSDATFSPDQVCTRAEIVTLLHRAYSRGYDYERVLEYPMIFQSILGTYIMPLPDGTQYRIEVQDAGGVNTDLTLWADSEEYGEERFLPYTDFYPFDMKGFKLRYYEDFLIFVIVDESSAYRCFEGIYTKEGHTLPDTVPETFAPLFSD